MKRRVRRLYRRLSLFISIVGRESADGSKLGVAEAWDIASAFYKRREPWDY